MTVSPSARSVGLCIALFVSGTLLVAQESPSKHPAASNPHLGNKDSIRAGMTLYRVRCADCHGLDAGGYRGPDLISLLASGASDERIFDTIRKGVPGTDMPAQS
jgi:mono/diheme cytochrome c family protein